MSLKINTNNASIYAHRQMVRNSNEERETIEHLSSGYKINQGADGPAQLQISEQLRAQVAGLRQAIDNTEMGVSLVQTAEAALDEVSRVLLKARQLSVHAANEAANDEFMLQADQQEFDNIVATINRIAASTQYGKNYLLDGSKAGNGVAVGDNLEFLEAGAKAKSSGANGYKVTIMEAAQRNEHAGTVALTQDIIDRGEQLTIMEGGRTLNFKTKAGTSVEQTLNELEAAIKGASLKLDLIRPDPGTTDNNTPQVIRLRHKEYGSNTEFTVASLTAGVLSSQALLSDQVRNGKDVVGEINGESAFGKGQELIGAPGALVEGIRVRYTGEVAPPNFEAGSIAFSQNSIRLQVGGNANQTVGVSLKSMKASQLSTGVQNLSGFNSLQDINLMDADKAQDAIRLVDRAIEEVAAARGELGAFQKNSLESNLNFLRIAHENVSSSESVIRDADMAQEMATFTRNQIMTDSTMAMLAQANQSQRRVVQLLS
jgi:flagellin